MAMAVDDPRRPLLLRRLGTERARIDELLGREPQLEDSDYDEWEQAVRSLIIDIFGAGSYLLRFRQLDIRPISYSVGGSRWRSDPKQAWLTGLKQAAKILDEAIEEGAISLPVAAKAETHSARAATPVVVNIHNQNIFSPEVHVTISQMLQSLDGLGLSDSEKTIAEEHLRELEVETKGSKRWPIIARSLESIKSIGKSVYKDVAVPLIVEFLKRESGLAGTL